MKILIVSPHPDDETLGAGGTLIKMKKLGHEIYWLNVTDISRTDGWEEKLVLHRLKQIRTINEFYKFDGFYNLAFPATKLSDVDGGEIIHAIKKIFEKVESNWIILPGKYDAHSDHRVVYDCCMAGAKTFRAPYIRRIMTMEIVSETDYGYQTEIFKPNLFIDITNELEGKLQAMKIYDTEIEAAPFPRSIENIKALAVTRGGTALCKYAEAFCIVKQIE